MLPYKECGTEKNDPFLRMGVKMDYSNLNGCNIPKFGLVLKKTLSRILLK